MKLYLTLLQTFSNNLGLNHKTNNGQWFNRNNSIFEIYCEKIVTKNGLFQQKKAQNNFLKTTREIRFLIIKNESTYNFTLQIFL